MLTFWDSPGFGSFNTASQSANRSRANLGIGRNTSAISGMAWAIGAIAADMVAAAWRPSAFRPCIQRALGFGHSGGRLAVRRVPMPPGGEHEAVRIQRERVEIVRPPLGHATHGGDIRVGLREIGAPRPHRFEIGTLPRPGGDLESRV